MAETTVQLLAQAIAEKRCVAIRYRSQEGLRVIEPHAVYTHEKGEILVDGYQLRGFSASGRPPPFWRPFRVKKISSLSVLKETFQPRITEGFSPTKLKYKNGLVAIVKSGSHRHLYSEEQLQQMGPALPAASSRYR